MSDQAKRINLLDLVPAEAAEVLHTHMEAIGAPAYRAAQVTRRLWVNPAKSFADMTELPAPLRESLAERFELPRLTVAAHQASTDGTRKFLFRLHDNEAIETVAIPEGDRMTICVSSQAGCALPCALCAAGAMGFTPDPAVPEDACQGGGLQV